jgi:hypothetical protein
MLTSDSFMQGVTSERIERNFERRLSHIEQVGVAKIDGIEAVAKKDVNCFFESAKI